MNRLLLRRAVTATTALALALLGLAGVADAAPQPAAQPSYVSACPPMPGPGGNTCLALRRTDVSSHKGITPDATPSGYGPADLQSAYNLTSAAASGGQGATVAITDVYDDTNAESDLANYRSQYGLPPCTTANGCFSKVNQNLQASPLPQANNSWAGEISLDLDAVSAICPNCHIVLVEANSANNSDLYAAVNNAAQKYHYLSNSWGDTEYSGETSDDTNFDHPGTVIAFAAGDNANQIIYPSSSRYVTAVGGTSLTRDSSTARGWSESVWYSSSTSGTGSGCSQYEPQPSWQQQVSNITGVCSKRATSDVSADADPNTGIAVYNTDSGSGWSVYGGTSAATPIITAVYALAGTPGTSDTPASYPYAHPGDLYDVTTGSNGSCGNALCEAGPGWDGPTGLGTPNGTAAFTAGSTPPGNDFSLAVDPASGTVAAGSTATTTVSTTVSTTVTAGSAGSVALTASGLPAGATASVNPASVTAGSSATLTVATTSATPGGSYPITVTGTEGSASHSATYTLTVTGGGGGVVNGGFETGDLSGWTHTGPVSVVTSPVHSGKYAAGLGSGTAGTATLSQTFTAAGDRLSLWYQQSCSAFGFGSVTVALTDNTSHDTTDLVDQFCGSGPSGWQQATAAVNAGTSYTVTITNDDSSFSGDHADSYVDDVT